MADDLEADWDQIAEQRASLEKVIDDLRKQIRAKQKEIEQLPSRSVGMPKGTVVRREDTKHTRCATILAYDMIQRWRHIEVTRGRTLTRENKLPPAFIRNGIVEKACEEWPLASQEQVLTKIALINADPENRPLSGGLLYRVRDTEWLAQPDKFLDDLISRNF